MRNVGMVRKDQTHHKQQQKNKPSNPARKTFNPASPCPVSATRVWAALPLDWLATVHMGSSLSLLFTAPSSPPQTVHTLNISHFPRFPLKCFLSHSFYTSPFQELLAEIPTLSHSTLQPLHSLVWKTSTSKVKLGLLSAWAVAGHCGSGNTWTT